MSKVVWGITVSLYFTIFLTTATNEQFSNNISIPADHPALQYSTRETFDAVARLNQKLAANTDGLEFDKEHGYLSSVLNKLGIHPDTQTLVFSETSFQSEQISPVNPRALYFNDTVAVGWVPNSRTLEIASQDPRQGVIFYSLEQNPEKKPTFQRNERCLTSTVTRLAQELIQMGCYEISLGDTSGVGTANQVTDLIERLKASITTEQLAVHFHDTYGQALTNIYAALQCGIHTIDCSVGGLGGCPYAPGAGGNVATEDVLYLLNGLGIQTGVDMTSLLAANRFIFNALRQPTPSKAAQALLNSVKKG